MKPKTLSASIAERKSRGACIVIRNTRLILKTKRQQDERRDERAALRGGVRVPE